MRSNTKSKTRLSTMVLPRFGQLKQALVAAALVLTVGSAKAQTGGTVNFGNHSSSLVINGLTSLPVAASNNVRAALYWAPLGSGTFVQLGATAPVGVPLPGVFVGGTRTTHPATPGGTYGLFQVRAWSGGYATYEQALPHAGILIGQSSVFWNNTGNPGGMPPSGPASLIEGFVGFTLTRNPGVSQPPTITCATNKTVQCGSTWTFDLPTAVDNCSTNNLQVYVRSTVTNGQCPQLITRTWNVTNSCDTNYATCSQVVTVVNTSVPLLISVSNQTVLVSWPYSFSGFVLQQNENLAHPAGWSAYDGTVSTNNGLNSVSITPPVGTRFFRLYHP